MQTTLIISVLGPDKVGLVRSLSEVLSHYQGSWTESRMSHLGGKFAGLLEVSIADTKVAELTVALKELETESLQIWVDSSNEGSASSSKKSLVVDILGQDRPGIIMDVTQQLAKLDVNIEQLESEIKPASMSGEILFNARLFLSLPENVSEESVQDNLEAMSDQFMVDIEIS